MNDNIPFKIVACTFAKDGVSGRHYDYKIPADMTVRVGQKVKVRNGHDGAWKEVTVTALDVQERPDVNYSWVIEAVPDQPAIGGLSIDGQTVANLQSAELITPASIADRFQPGSGGLTGHALAADLRSEKPQHVQEYEDSLNRAVQPAPPPDYDEEAF